MITEPALKNAQAPYHKELGWTLFIFLIIESHPRSVPLPGYAILGKVL